MRFKKLIALVATVCVTMAMGSVAAFAETENNYVTVNNGTTKYASLDEAALSDEATGESITYTVYGSVNYGGAAAEDEYVHTSGSIRQRTAQNGMITLFQPAEILILLKLQHSKNMMDTSIVVS